MPFECIMERYSLFYSIDHAIYRKWALQRKMILQASRTLVMLFNYSNLDPKGNECNRLFLKFTIAAFSFLSQMLKSWFSSSILVCTFFAQYSILYWWSCYFSFCNTSNEWRDRMRLIPCWSFDRQLDAEGGGWWSTGCAGWVHPISPTGSWPL